MRREIPFLGVCLGAQLLALAHGGEVSRLQRRLVAWAPLKPLTHDDDDPIVDALPAGAHGLHWNQDGIEPPPTAAELLERHRAAARKRSASAASRGASSSIRSSTSPRSTAGTRNGRTCSSRRA